MTIARHLTLLSFLCTMTRAADSQQPSPRPTTLAHRSTVYAPHGMIATSQPLATAAGLGVLERGGNAIDAAVTAAAVLNVVEPSMTGIGGDLFALGGPANGSGTPTWRARFASSPSRERERCTAASSATGSRSASAPSVAT